MASNYTDFANDFLINVKDDRKSESSPNANLKKRLLEIIEEERRAEEDGLSILMQIDEMDHQLEIMSLQLGKIKVLKDQYFHALKQQFQAQAVRTQPNFADYGTSTSTYKTVPKSSDTDVRRTLSFADDMKEDNQVPYLHPYGDKHIRIPESTMMPTKDERKESLLTLTQNINEFSLDNTKLFEKEVSDLRERYLQQQKLKVFVQTLDKPSDLESYLSNTASARLPVEQDSLLANRMPIRSEIDSRYESGNVSLMPPRDKSGESDFTPPFVANTISSLNKTEEPNSGNIQAMTSAAVLPRKEIEEVNTDKSIAVSHKSSVIIDNQVESLGIVPEENKLKITTGVVNTESQKENNSLSSEKSVPHEENKELNNDADVYSDLPTCEILNEVEDDNSLAVASVDSKKDDFQVVGDQENVNIKKSNLASEIHYEEVETNDRNIALVQEDPRLPSKGETKQQASIKPSQNDTSPLISQNNSALSENEDSCSDKKVPLTSSAAYQSLIGAVPFPPIVNQQITIEDSESEDDVERALAMAVKVKEPTVKEKSVSMPSGTFKYKLSEASRKALGLDSDSDDTQYNKPKKPVEEEDSDEFDFYD